MKPENWKIRVDTGGTFTDCIALSPDGTKKNAKVLSNSSLRGLLVEKIQHRIYRIEQDWDAPSGFIDGFLFKQMLSGFETEVISFDASSSEILLKNDLPDYKSDQKVAFEVLSEEEAPVLAARLVTSTPAGKPLPQCEMRLATTRGTNALLERAGSGVALFITKGYGDLLKIGNQQRPDLFALKIQKTESLHSQVVEVQERLDSDGKVIHDIQLENLRLSAESMLNLGIRSAAVCFMHSYINPIHEGKAGNLLLSMGFEHVSLSSELAPFIRILPRTHTCVVNAFLSPVIELYLDSVSQNLGKSQLFIMNSSGGLAARSTFTPKDSLLSGPAGGIVGAAETTKASGYKKIISFDMGGTSTDVARYHGDYEYVFEHKVGDAQLMAPALHIETVAAGGGSVCYFDGYTLCVGPQSAGAYPGPACYGAGGPMTVTDVNLLLGRLDSRNFHIPVNLKNAEIKLEDLQKQIIKRTGETLEKSDILTGFLKIANERMADAIRRISVRKGYDTSEYVLTAFGGAGGQHACAIARLLNMNTIVIPENSGLLSAEGLGMSRIQEIGERQILRPLSEIKLRLSKILEELSNETRLKHPLGGKGTGNQFNYRKLVALRFEGQENAVDVDITDNTDLEDLFRQAYIKQFGHWLEDTSIEVVSARVVVSDSEKVVAFHQSKSNSATDAVPIFHKEIFHAGKWIKTPVFDRYRIKQNTKLNGPALILDPYSTVYTEPGWSFEINQDGSLIMHHTKEGIPDEIIPESKTVRLELFTNRLTSIAAEMGEILKRTAISVNVRDRLDFSCALLSPEGDLIVNAPHIPVHLGALGLCVRKVADTIKMEPGDVVVTNHPAYGGSHLPDITVITPVFLSDGALTGYAASRAHHAEIGGVTPGSMPPGATTLAEEGVVIPPVYLIRKGKPRWDELRELLTSGEYPSRNPRENLADLRAAVAANHRGAELLTGLAQSHGKLQVLHYMRAIKLHAAHKVRETLRNICNGEYVTEEFLDDGTPLKAAILVSDNEMIIDFSGTGAVHPGNLNATPAIVNSVVMYVIRLLINEPLPLNDGLLEPIKIILPDCLLNPGFVNNPQRCPAVVGGNIEVSQRLTDTLLKPFKRVACSQGTMNNVLFGNSRFGYYETVGGGTGAGPDFDGADAVHHHMTNTRGTDPEILEHHYPVRLECYAVRKNSGGKGKHKGGDGIVRELKFLEPVNLTVLTQHRMEGPYGQNGGEAGKPGLQRVIRKSGKEETLKSTDGRELQAGDSFILETPGGGGFGKN